MCIFFVNIILVSFCISVPAWISRWNILGPTPTSVPTRIVCYQLPRLLWPWVPTSPSTFESSRGVPDVDCVLPIKSWLLDATLKQSPCWRAYEVDTIVSHIAWFLPPSRAAQPFHAPAEGSGRRARALHCDSSRGEEHRVAEQHLHRLRRLPRGQLSPCRTRTRTATTSRGRWSGRTTHAWYVFDVMRDTHTHTDRERERKKLGMWERSRHII